MSGMKSMVMSPWTQPGNFSGIQESNSVHGNYVQIWLNEISSEFLHDTTAGMIMPSGSIIIKEAYSDILGENTTGITVMKKITDYDPTHNDWFWVSYGSLAGKMVLKNFVIAVTILERITFYLMDNRLNTFINLLK